MFRHEEYSLEIQKKTKIVYENCEQNPFWGIPGAMPNEYLNKEVITLILRGLQTTPKREFQRLPHYLA